MSKKELEQLLPGEWFKEYENSTKVWTLMYRQPNRSGELVYTCLLDGKLKEFSNKIVIKV